MIHNNIFKNQMRDFQMRDNNIFKNWRSSTIDTNISPGKIIVLAIPPGARIYLDDIDTGVNASAIISDVSINTHTIELKLPGYNDFTETFTMTEPEETRLISTIMTPIVPPIGVGSLNVTSTPSNAEFYIYSETEEIANGITPTLEPITNIPTGIYGYEAGIAENGTSVAMGSVTIKAGETTNLHIPIPPYSPDNGIVAIESIPVGADIYIDGEPIDTKTSYMTLMSPGLHTYELRKPGYQSKSGDLTVVTGYDMPTIISETLLPVSDIGAVVMLAGAVAVGMMLVPKKK